MILLNMPSFENLACFLLRVIKIMFANALKVRTGGRIGVIVRHYSYEEVSAIYFQ